MPSGLCDNTSSQLDTVEVGFVIIQHPGNVSHSNLASSSAGYFALFDVRLLASCTISAYAVMLPEEILVGTLKTGPR
jgi:hypothetical protein